MEEKEQFYVIKTEIAENVNCRKLQKMSIAEIAEND